MYKLYNTIENENFQKENESMIKEKLIGAGTEGAYLFSGWDHAIVGVTEDNRVVYSFEKIIETLKSRDGLTDEEAEEWISYNLHKSLPYLEDKAPVIMYPLPD